ncbi:MAG TPA: septal ring lytic transglycosylase RlpA family protein [Stellaceae bacterium]|nr:septal ring lytic transglycosylase RlpA family protein [Stellaceae bacterium]
MRTIAAVLLLCGLSIPSIATAGAAKHAKDTQLSRSTASVYARSLVGRRAANGERLQHLTAASLKLPLGTVVTVTNRRNGRKATVRVNDRGPYARRFIIDLSPAAAAALGIGRRGTAPVELKIAQAGHRG